MTEEREAYDEEMSEVIRMFYESIEHAEWTAEAIDNLINKRIEQALSKLTTQDQPTCEQNAVLENSDIWFFEGVNYRLRGKPMPVKKEPFDTVRKHYNHLGWLMQDEKMRNYDKRHGLTTPSKEE